MREWRGIKDTIVDYHYWLANWKALLVFVLKSPIQFLKALSKYRWLFSYLHTHEFVDRHTQGLRGTALKVAHLHYSSIVKHLTEILHNTFNHQDEVVVIDELIPPQIVVGMGLKTCPLELAPYFISSMVDQQITKYYIDAVENYGVPADVCPLPSGSAGVAIEDDYPKTGKCAVVSNMPCDGSAATTAIIDRRINLPTHILDVPLRYDEEGGKEIMVEELKEMIAFIEENTGKKMDWNRLREVCETYNKQSEYEIEKWEINRTDYPQVTGASLWLYRIYYYQMGAGHPLFVKTDKKVNKLIKKAYKNKELCTKNPKYRAILWNCPSNYYTHLSLWTENAWGVSVLNDLETHTSVDLIDTSTPDTMLEGIAHQYSRATMRKHTKGGYPHALDELWQLCEEYNADFVLMTDQISCKGMDALGGIYEEEARKRNIKICWVQHDLMDPRTISRQQMRDSVNKFMYNIMQAEPVDESLLEIEDHQAW
ncbi:2-hydroxyacyl-CoA dehydratase family protein [Tepidibacter sp. Z1-5]|uniref:2-hydroxyacyl-CoA dehydratase family protein n=1 Tax=Tepidibacter sp. Z1-5 TaxID=3134138 RepID=UPI0030C0451D